MTLRTIEPWPMNPALAAAHKAAGIRRYVIVATGFTDDPAPGSNGPRSQVTGYGLVWQDDAGAERTQDGFATALQAFQAAIDLRQAETGRLPGRGCDVTSWPASIIERVQERLA